MGRYIDVEAFREEMDNHFPFDKFTQDHEPILNLAKSRIIRLLATFSAADVEPVIKCDNCIYKDSCCRNMFTSFNDYPVDLEWCSAGEIEKDE